MSGLSEINCPDCQTPWKIGLREPCPGCALTVDDLEAVDLFVAALLERAHRGSRGEVSGVIPYEP